MTSLIAIAAVLLAAPAQQGELSQTDRDSLVQYYETTRDNFLNSVKGLSEAQLQFKAAPDRWSVAEVAEHIAVAEAGIRQRIDEGVLKSPATPEKAAEVKGKDEQIVKMLADRSKKFKAPEPLQPQHKFKSLDETLKAYSEARAKNLEYIKTTKLDLRSHFATGPAGLFDAYQWLLFLAAHSARHTAQIEEVKADPNFPKT